MRGVPFCQYDEICRIAGPLSPRCVINIFSRKRWPLHAAITSVETACQVGIGAGILVVERDRYQAGPGLKNFQAKLAGQPVAEVGGAGLRNRQASGGDHQNGRPKLSLASAHDKFIAAVYFFNRDLRQQMNAGIRTFLFEHPQDVLRGAVAEELTQGLFVIRNVMLLHQRDKIRRRVPDQRGFYEVRICRDKVFRLAMKVGEIAASAAGDENLLSRSVSAFEYGNAASPAAGFNRTHEPGGSSAKNQGVISVNVRGHSSLATQNISRPEHSSNIHWRINIRREEFSGESGSQGRVSL